MKKILQKVVLSLFLFNYESFATLLTETDIQTRSNLVFTKAQTHLLCPEDRAYLKDFVLLNKQAKQGECKAQNYLGHIYLRGNNIIEPDTSLAYHWLTKAMEGGMISAYIYLSDIIQAGAENNNVKAFELAQKGAEAQNPLAYFALSWFYLKGTGTAVNIEKAFDYHDRAAELDFSVLAAKLTDERKYTDIEDTNPECSNDFTCFINELKESYAICHNNVGIYYLTGKNVPKDAEKGIKYLKKACELGLKSAHLALGRCYFQGKYVAQNYAKAEKWLTMPAIKDDPVTIELLKKVKAENNKGSLYSFFTSFFPI